ncbi:hypothetical protein BGX38DRAFT_1270040 [Terfezia claveryi]|nr:hypothetical protein BGX38DRAFT_1270040 [Terfezia claveryi]
MQDFGSPSEWEGCHKTAWEREGTSDLWAVPTLDNSPRYETPDPGPTPRVELSGIFKKKSGSIMFVKNLVFARVIDEEWTKEEAEEAWWAEQTAEVLRSWGDPPVRKSQEKEEEACSGSSSSSEEDAVGSGPLGRQRNLLAEMDRGKWKKVGKFLFKNTMGFLGLTAFEPNIDIFLIILEEDGAVDGEGKEQLANTFERTLDELKGYQGRGDDYEVRLAEKEGVIASLSEEVQRLSNKSDVFKADKELSELKRTLIIFADQGVWMKNQEKESEDVGGARGADENRQNGSCRAEEIAAKREGITS